MYSFLVRVLLFLCGLWLVRRFLGIFFKAETNRDKSNNSEVRKERLGNDTVKDPVCGMYMDPRLAIRLEDRKGNYYFCSDECKRRFMSEHQ